MSLLPIAEFGMISAETAFRLDLPLGCPKI